jgi:hypothetical protein
MGVHPTDGRWSQPDPINQVDDVVQSNRYGYVGGNPVGFSDPSGTKRPANAGGDPCPDDIYIGCGTGASPHDKRLGPIARGLLNCGFGVGGALLAARVPVIGRARTEKVGIKGAAAACVQSVVGYPPRA